MLSYEKPADTRHDEIILVTILLLFSLDKCQVLQYGAAGICRTYRRFQVVENSLNSCVDFFFC